MFIEITKKENNNPIKMNTLFIQQRDAGYTPEFAMEILRSTNHYGNIKRVAKYITGLKTNEERLAYKDFVIGAVERRETTPDTFRLLYGLACDGGYDVEFFEAYNKPKEYGIDYCNFKTKHILCKSKHDELPQDLRDYDRVVLDYAEYDEQYASPVIKFSCKECCVQNATRMGFRQNESQFIEAEKFRFKNIAVLENSVYADTNCVEFVDCNNVDFSMYGDKANTKDLEIIAKNVKRLAISVRDYHNRHIKCELDNVDALILNGVNLECFDIASLKGAKSVLFDECSSYPKNVDLSHFDDVRIVASYGFRKVEDIKFKEGSKVCILPSFMCDPDGICAPSMIAFNMPANLDFSKCSEVILGGELGAYDRLSFGEGAKVKFCYLREYPKVLDVSMCSEVSFDNVDNINEIVFKDMAQLQDIVKSVIGDEKEQKRVVSTLKKKATFINEPKSKFSKLWDRGV